MRLHSEKSGMKRGLRVWTLVIVGGLLALLMVAAVACDEDAPAGGGSPTSTGERTVGAGELLWKHSVSGIDAFLIEDGVVVIGIESLRYGDDESRELHALDAETGGVLWRLAVGFSPRWGHRSLRLSDGVVYFVDTKAAVAPAPTPGLQTTLHAIDATTGRALWRYELEPGFRPEWFAVPDAVVIADSDSIFALNAATGQLLWDGNLDAIPQELSDSVVYTDSFKDTSAYAVVALDAGTRSLLWGQEGMRGMRREADGIVLILVVSLMD